MSEPTDKNTKYIYNIKIFRKAEFLNQFNLFKIFDDVTFFWKNWCGVNKYIFTTQKSHRDALCKVSAKLILLLLQVRGTLVRLQVLRKNYFI